jgi:DNA polymerase III subunit epsilon
MVAIDLETTGFSAGKDAILSIGVVQIDGLAIQLATARHWLIRNEAPLPEASVVIHRITDDAAGNGLPLANVWPELLMLLQGRVMVAHHAHIEQTFLDHAMRTLHNCALWLPVIDTEVIARRSFERRNQPFRGHDLRLANLRQRYGLPRHPAHNALSDALATAELLLAQIAEGNATESPLKTFIRG